MKWNDGTEYRDNLPALIKYLPKDDLYILDFWFKKFLLPNYRPDTDPLGLDNFNGADLTLAAHGGDCESLHAVIVEVLRAWGWDVDHCVVFFKRLPHHDFAIYKKPDGSPGWYDYGINEGNIKDLKSYLETRYKNTVLELWAVNDIGEKIKRLDK